MAKLNERVFVGKKVLVEAKSLPTTWDLAKVRQLQADLEQLDGRKWDMAWTRSFRLWAEDGYPAVLDIEADSGTITIEDVEKPQSWVVGKESTIEELLQLYKKVEQTSKRSFQGWSVVGDSKDEVLDQLMDRFEDIDQETYDELFPNGIDWDTPWSEYAGDCINYFDLKSKIKKQKDGTYKLILKKEPSDLLADYAATLEDRDVEEKLSEMDFSKSVKGEDNHIKEELINTDGWGEEIPRRLEPVFRNLEDLMYEVRNAVRGSYAVNGDTVQDLVGELRDLADQLSMNADDLEFDQESLNEAKGFLRKYKGCSIHDMNDTYVVTNEHGKTIGQSKTESGCEAIIDDYVKDKGNVDESCEKEDNKLQEDTAMTDQERVKIFADYFDIDAEDCDYNAEDHTIESPVGDFYFGTYDEMVDRAIANESEMIDDMGLGLFTPNFRSEIVGNPELYDMHWFAEYWDDYNATADEEDEISYGDDEEAAQLYADTFGEEAFAEAVEKLLDKEAVTREVIKWDGVAGILAAYDGNEEDLGHGLYAYRWN